MTDPQLNGLAAIVTSEQSAVSQEGLHRRLSQRQLTMMAIGGAIGVGLFLGSSVTLRLAGPAVILSYLLGAGIALIMSYVLAEMAVVHLYGDARPLLDRRCRALARGCIQHDEVIPRAVHLGESHRSPPILDPGSAAAVLLASARGGQPPETT